MKLKLVAGGQRKEEAVQEIELRLQEFSSGVEVALWREGKPIPSTHLVKFQLSKSGKIELFLYGSVDSEYVETEGHRGCIALAD